MDAQEAATHVATGLKNYYSKYVLPIEKNYQFDKFATPLLNDADFLAKPMVLLMGQYSVGKTTFVRYLLERDFPGARIGPEPTTDKFVAVMYGNNERVIPGNAAAVQNDKPFKALETFGMAFLNRFEVSEVSCPILEHITLIDSPGILSGEKQRIQRGYDFPSVVSYWATRADRILLLFDAHKLDISDEFQNAILALKGNFDKIRCVLNKSDQVTQQQLMRVYGALLWSLGKVVQTPEVMRVYISSFWDKPYRFKEAKKLFDLEKNDLLNDLKTLPRHSAVRKVNEFVKRTRRAKVHSLICDTLRSKFGLFGKEKKQKELLNTMDSIFRQVSAKYNVPMGDFPNPQKFAQIMKSFEMWKFSPLKPQQVTAIDEVLGRGIPGLLSQIEFKANRMNNGIEEKTDQSYNPFAGPKDEMANMKLGGSNWIVKQSMKEQYDSKFFQLQLINSKASGSQVKQIMLQYGLNNDILARIWELSDIDKDGSMNSDEFALCCYLLESVKNGKQLPQTLPDSYIPPSFRNANLQQNNYFQAPNQSQIQNNNNNNNNNQIPQSPMQQQQMQQQMPSPHSNNYDMNNNNINNNNNNNNNMDTNVNSNMSDNNNYMQQQQQQQQQGPPMMSQQQPQQQQQMTNQEPMYGNDTNYGSSAW